MYNRALNRAAKTAPTKNNTNDETIAEPTRPRVVAHRRGSECREPAPRTGDATSAFAAGNAVARHAWTGLFLGRGRCRDCARSRSRLWHRWCECV